jgi:hypothetical protein
MKLVKSLLLGSAAGLVAVAGASAADLGVKKPTAVDYVRTCPQYGAGFFVVPGTTSCLKLIGRVRVEYLFNDVRSRGSDSNTFVARGYIGYDHRTATEYGLLRTYVRAFIGRNNAGTASTRVTALPTYVGGAAAYAPVLEYAFIQFGGLTVGRITPVFEHGFGTTNAGSGGFGGFSDIAYVNSFGYTFQFGGGFSATVALDAANERKTGFNNNHAVSAGGGITTLTGPGVGQGLIAPSATLVPGTGMGGQAMPDVVASLDYTASWGQVKLAGAIHQVRDAGDAGLIASTRYGWALTGALKVNLPMISAGSNVWVNGTYADGAVSYAGFSSATIGQVGIQFYDATTINGLPNRSMRLAKAWALSGGFQVFASPTVSFSMLGTYGSYDPFGAANTINTWSVTGQAAWTPVSGMTIAADVGYVSARYGSALRPAVVGLDRSHWVGRVRFQRDF